MTKEEALHEVFSTVISDAKGEYYGKNMCVEPSLPATIAIGCKWWNDCEAYYLSYGKQILGYIEHELCATQAIKGEFA